MWGSSGAGVATAEPHTPPPPSWRQEPPGSSQTRVDIVRFRKPTRWYMYPKVTTNAIMASGISKILAFNTLVSQHIAAIGENNHYHAVANLVHTTSGV
jgi:hypothetical protein